MSKQSFSSKWDLLDFGDEDIELFENDFEEASEQDLTIVLRGLENQLQTNKHGGDFKILLEEFQRLLNSRGLIVVYD